MEKTTYTALCERAGRWWTIRIPQVDGLTAQVRSLEQAEMMTRQTIVRALGVAPESVVVEVVPEAPVAVANALQVRHAARKALEQAVQATVQALESLAQEGHSFDDAAVMLGLSPAEIAQYSPAAASPAGDDVRDSGPLEMVTR